MEFILEDLTVYMIRVIYRAPTLNLPKMLESEAGCFGLIWEEANQMHPSHLWLTGWTPHPRYIDSLHDFYLSGENTWLRLGLFLWSDDPPKIDVTSGPKTAFFFRGRENQNWRRQFRSVGE